MKKATVLIMTMFIILFTGCTPKVITKTKYLESKPYNFKKLNIDRALIKIEKSKKTKLSLKQVREICAPSMINMDNFFQDKLDFYDYQIDDYLSKQKDK